MDWIDTLSSGLLSHTIIPSSRLTELWDHVKRKLKEHIKEYGILFFQIPIYVKHYQQQKPELLSLQIVPVPYHLKRKSPEENHAYTWLKPDHYMLAMSSLIYLA